jgi:hypothetical protein
VEVVERPLKVKVLDLLKRMRLVEVEVKEQMLLELSNFQSH